MRKCYYIFTSCARQTFSERTLPDKQPEKKKKNIVRNFPTWRRLFPLPTLAGWSNACVTQRRFRSSGMALRGRGKTKTNVIFATLGRSAEWVWIFLNFRSERRTAILRVGRRVVYKNSDIFLSIFFFWHRSIGQDGGLRWMSLSAKVSGIHVPKANVHRHSLYTQCAG